MRIARRAFGATIGRSAAIDRSLFVPPPPVVLTDAERLGLWMATRVERGLMLGPSGAPDVQEYQAVAGWADDTANGRGSSGGSGIYDALRGEVDTAPGGAGTFEIANGDNAVDVVASGAYSVALRVSINDYAEDTDILRAGNAYALTLLSSSGEISWTVNGQRIASAPLAADEGSAFTVTIVAGPEAIALEVGGAQSSGPPASSPPAPEDFASSPLSWGPDSSSAGSVTGIVVGASSWTPEELSRYRQYLVRPASLPPGGLENVDAWPATPPPADRLVDPDSAHAAVLRFQLAGTPDYADPPHSSDFEGVSPTPTQDDR